MKLFNSIFPKILNNPQQLVVQKLWIKDKYFIFNFMQYNQIWKLYIRDIQKIFEYFAYVLRNNPQLFSRATELSMDGLWEKDHFPISNFPKLFLDIVRIENFYNITLDHFLIGDVWNYHNVEVLCKEMHFNQNNSIKLHLTLHGFWNETNPSIQKLITINKQYTSNTAVDVYIDNMSYNFKNNPDINYLSNNIHLLDVGECALKKVNGYTYALESRLRTSKLSHGCLKNLTKILNYINKTLKTKVPPQKFSIVRIIERVETLNDKPKIEELDITEQEAEIIHKTPLFKGAITTHEIKNAQKAIIGILENLERLKKKSIIGAGIACIIGLFAYLRTIVRHRLTMFFYYLIVILSVI